MLRWKLGRFQTSPVPLLFFPQTVMQDPQFPLEHLHTGLLILCLSWCISQTKCFPRFPCTPIVIDLYLLLAYMGNWLLLMITYVLWFFFFFTHYLNSLFASCTFSINKLVSECSVPQPEGWLVPYIAIVQQDPLRLKLSTPCLLKVDHYHNPQQNRLHY